MSVDQNNRTPTANKNDDELDAIFNEFPAEIRWMLKSAWEKVPLTQRNQLIDLLPMLPSNQTAAFNNLLDMAKSQVEMAFGSKRDIAIVGPANVGKSTLYNQFIQAKKDTADVSPIPGTTKVNQAADAGLFTIVDTPGADAAGESGEAEREQALMAARAADLLIIMFDATVGIRRSEQLLFHQLKTLEKPFIVVLNKMDAIGRRQKEGVLGQAAVNLVLPASQILPISAQEGKKLERVLLAIVKSEPALMAALGQALPAYRARLAWQAIVRAATTSAVIALTPIPIADLVPLLATQATLVLSIARIYDYKLTPARAKELVGTFGVGYVGRTVFYQLSKLGGPPGWLLSAAVAASTTVVVGVSAIQWFSKGEKLTAEATKRMTEQVTQRLLERLRGVWRRRPSRKSLSKEMSAVLEDLEKEQEV